MLRLTIVAALLALLLPPPPAAAAPALSEAAGWLQQYLRIDTTNPPGREDRAAAFLAGILQREGIPSRIVKGPGGRANLHARLSSPRSGGKAVVLLHHMDVVPASRSFWRKKKQDMFHAAIPGRWCWVVITGCRIRSGGRFPGGGGGQGCRRTRTTRRIRSGIGRWRSSQSR